MKYLLSLGLALGLVFTVSAVSLAVPVVGAEGGQLVVFADRDWWADNIGAGYGISDEITLGAVYDMTNETYGAFANLTFNRLAVQAENWFVHGNNLSTVTGSGTSISIRSPWVSGAGSILGQRMIISSSRSLPTWLSARTYHYTALCVISRTKIRITTNTAIKSVWHWNSRSNGLGLNPKKFL